jgi:hypothetical protein
VSSEFALPLVVAGSCLAAIAVVAAAVAKKRQRDKQRSAPLNKPLLEEGGDSELLVLRDTAKFDIETGAPTNTAAQRLCMLQWVAGEPESVRELPYVDIEAAAGQFGPANQLASGGSCTVFRGNLYGLDVAIKQLHTDADEWNNTQFETEMRLLWGELPRTQLCMLQWVAGEPESVRELPYVDFSPFQPSGATAALFGGSNVVRLV